MNYYEHHLGDYAAATGHLSWDEDMAYTRLIRAYYHHEKPIPADLKAACRLVRAATPAQRKAVESVLGEFFVLDPDGWRQKRCDAEIRAFHQGEPEREAKKVNESLRLQRHREERAALFAVLNSNGEHASWNTPIAELRTLAKRYAPPLPATAPATPATATQTPDTRHQTPDLKTYQGDTSPINSPRDGARPSPGEVCKAMRDAGISKVNPSNPVLHRLIAEGATIAEFVDAVPGSLSDHVKSPFAHALGTVEGRRKESAIRANGGGSARDIARADTLHTLTGGLISDRATKTRKDATHGRTIDGEAKRVD